MKKVFIEFNTSKLLAVQLAKDSKKYFKEKNVEVVETPKEADFAVIIGGDGTLLRAFKKLIKNRRLYTIAINAGNLGFLAEIKKENFYEEIENFLLGNFKSEKRNILEIKIRNKKYYALNEVAILKTGATSKVLKIKFNSNDEYMCDYKGDGVIVATPTGSTAYSLSAGGPILKSDMKAIVITPIAPHNLNTRPIVIGGEENLCLEIEDKNRVGQIIIDGETNIRLKSGEKVEIKYSEKSLKLVIPRDRNYYSVLREKLKWGDNLC